MWNQCVRTYQDMGMKYKHILEYMFNKDMTGNIAGSNHPTIIKSWNMKSRQRFSSKTLPALQKKQATFWN